MIALERRAEGASLVFSPAAMAWLLAGLAVLAALVTRIAGLSYLPLQQAESVQAYEAWLLYHGQLETYVGSPLLTNLQALAFFLFSDTDLSARLPALLCGLGLVALPLCMQGLAPGWRALASVLLALSSFEVLAGRAASTADVSAFLFGLLVVSVWNYAHGPRRLWALVAATALGLGVTSDPAFVVSVLVALGAAALMWCRTSERWRPAAEELALAPVCLAVACGAFVLGSTYALTSPIGLQAGLSNLWRWTADLGIGEPARLLAWPLEDPLPLFLGAVGAGLILCAPDGRARVLVGWAVLAVLLALVAKAPDQRYLALAVLPLALLGATALVAAWNARELLRLNVYLVGVLALVPIVFLLFSGLQRAASGQQLPLVVALFGVGSFGLIVLYATTVLPRRSAIAAVLVALALLGLFLQARGIASLTIGTPLPGASILVPRAVLPAAFDVEATAVRWARADPTGTISVDERLLPLLQWRLRDVPSARFVRPQPPLGSSAILGADVNRALLGSRRVSRIPIEATADPLDAFRTPVLAVRWLASREIPGGTDTHAILLAR